MNITKNLPIPTFTPCLKQWSQQLTRYFFILFLLIGSHVLLSTKNSAANSGEMGVKDNAPSQLVFVTYISNHEQEKQAKALIKSIRELSGNYRQTKIYVVLGKPETVPGNSLKMNGVEILPVAMDASFKSYPFTIKAFAAAQVEELVKDKCHTLVYVDPDVLITGPIDGLDLDDGAFDVALRTVSLNNNIGLLPEEKPNDYWQRIYDECGIDFKEVPVLPTIVDEVAARGYMNCQVYSVNPELGILRKWAILLEKLLRDKEYQEKACPSFTRKIFLHQAVFSGVIFSEIKKGKIRSLELKYDYPFSHHNEMAEAKRANRLNDLAVIVFDWSWTTNPNWMDVIPIEEPLKGWLFKTYLDYLQITDNLYRVEGSCNSYLITTNDGSVLIDPAGAFRSPQWFRHLMKKFPLKAILLTHGHADHREHIQDWKAGEEIPVIAQREHKQFVQYQDMLAGYFTRRNAIWRGESVPEDIPLQTQTPIEPTVFFIDNYSFELGGYHFYLIHTPGETPDAATIWVPELKTVFVGDNYYEFFPNIYTLRGTPTRPALGYIAALDTALAVEPEFFCMGHRLPLIGKEHIQKTVRNFRDVLHFIHDKTVQGMNEGKDVYTLMQEIDFPAQYDPVPEYYGKVDWSVRGIYEGYIGWFDGNPANMYELPVAAIFPDLVKLAGGVENIIKPAQLYFEKSEYVKVLQLTEVALAANPEHRGTWEIRLKTLEALKRGPYNYIEHIFLDEGIRKAKEKLNQAIK